MINFIKKLFRPPASAPEEQGDLLRLARGVEARVDKLANETFVQYKDLLLVQNITYIVTRRLGCGQGSPTDHGPERDQRHGRAGFAGYSDCPGLSGTQP